MAWKRNFVGVAKATDLGVTFRVSKNGTQVVTSTMLDTVVSNTGNLIVPTWPLDMLNTPVANAGKPAQYLEYKLEETADKK